MPKNPGVDLIAGPVQMAEEMIRAQQEHIIEQLKGPQAPQRRVMLGDIPLEDIMPQILADMEQPQ